MVPYVGKTMGALFEEKPSPSSVAASSQCSPQTAEEGASAIFPPLSVCSFRQPHGSPVPWDSPDQTLTSDQTSLGSFSKKRTELLKNDIKNEFHRSLKGSSNHLKLVLWTILDVAQCNSLACFDVQQGHYDCKAATPQTIFRWNFNCKSFRLIIVTKKKHETSVKPSLANWFCSVGG